MGDKAATPESLGLTPVRKSEEVTPESLGLTPANTDPADIAGLKGEIPRGVYAESRGLDAMATTQNPNYISLDSRVNESPVDMLSRSFAEKAGPAAGVTAGVLRGLPLVGGLADEAYGTGAALFTDQSYEDARKDARGALDAAAADYPVTSMVADIAAGTVAGGALLKMAKGLSPDKIATIAKQYPKVAKILQSVLKSSATVEGRMALQSAEGARRGFAESERESFLGTLGDMYIMAAAYAAPEAVGALGRAVTKGVRGRDGNMITKGLKQANTERAAAKARADLEDKFRRLWGSTTKELQEATASAYGKGKTLSHVFEQEASWLKQHGIDIAGKTRDEIGIALAELKSKSSESIRDVLTTIDGAMPNGFIKPSTFSNAAELVLQNAKSAGGMVQAGRAAKLLKDEARFISEHPEKATAEFLQEVRSRLANDGWDVLNSPGAKRSDAEPYFAALNMVDSMLEEAAKAVDGIAKNGADGLYKTLSDARQTWGLSSRMLMGAAKPEKKTFDLIRTLKSWVVDSAGESLVNSLVNTVSSDAVAKIAAASARGPRAVIALCYSLRRTAKSDKEKKIYEEFMRNVSLSPERPQTEEYNPE